MTKLILNILLIFGFTVFALQANAGNSVIENATVIKKTEKRLIKRILEILEKSDGDDVYDRDALKEAIQTTQFEIAEAYSSIVHDIVTTENQKTKKRLLKKLKKKLDKTQYRSVVSLLRVVDRNKSWMDSGEVDDLIIDRSEALAKRQTRSIKRGLFRKRNIAADTVKTANFKKLLAGA